ncbi:MAG: hypothetical protein WC654_05755 [Patescibacteria group bacterium]
MSEKNPLEKPPISPQLEGGLPLVELREKLRDHSYLPTHAFISRAFTSEDFSSQEWHRFVDDKEHPVFEFLNEEFLNAFSDYFSQRIDNLGASKDSPVTILEVGAGNGRLSHFLQKKLDAKLLGKVKVIPTDSGELSLKTTFPIEIIGHKKALEKYKPKIVIFSWMPYGSDFTDDFRAAESVDEYILIGETDDGNCGDAWRTWGISDSPFHEGAGKVAPYLADGFERKDLDDVSKQQICRTDELGEYFHSKTVSFRRKK